VNIHRGGNLISEESVFRAMFRYHDSSRTSVFRSASRRHRPRCARRRKKIRGILPSASFLIPTTGGRGNLPGCGNFLCNIREIFSEDPQSLSKSTPCMISLRYGKSFVADVAGERERAMRSAFRCSQTIVTRGSCTRARIHARLATIPIRRLQVLFRAVGDLICTSTRND